MFSNRIAAAYRLIPFLRKYKGKEGVVLAVPRGGVPIAYIVAKELSLPLSVVLSKKIGHPAMIRGSSQGDLHHLPKSSFHGNLKQSTIRSCKKSQTPHRKENPKRT